MLEELKPYKAELDEFRRKIVGSSLVNLTRYRSGEGSIGSFMADAMVWAYRNRTRNGERIRLALINSGGMRQVVRVGNVTVGDLLTTLPFSNTFDLVPIQGRNLRTVLEHSVKK